MPVPVRLSPIIRDPLVSVLISNYNHASYLSRSVLSAFEQTYSRIELIVCDDGSTDDSRNVLKLLKSKYNPPFYTLLVHEKENGGQSSAINAAFQKCSGEIICFLDSDDYFYPNKVTSIVQAFHQHPDAGFLIHRLDKVDTQEKEYGQIPLAKTMPSGWFGDYVAKNGSCPPGFPVTSGLSVRREIAELIFPVNEKIVYDLDEMIRRLALLTTRVISLDESLGVYRIHGENVTSLNVVERIEKMLPIYDVMWRETRKFLETASPNDLSGYPDLDQDIHHLLMNYVLRRVEQDDREASILWRIIKQNSSFRKWPATRRLFWMITANAPDPLFKWLIHFYWNSEGYKLQLSRFTYLFQQKVQGYTDETA